MWSKNFLKTLFPAKSNIVLSIGAKDHADRQVNPNTPVDVSDHFFI